MVAVGSRVVVVIVEDIAECVEVAIWAFVCKQKRMYNIIGT